MLFKKKEVISQRLRTILQSNWLLLALVLFCTTRLVASSIMFTVPHTGFFADITKQALEFSVNQTRQALNLQTLTEDPALQAVAQMKAEDMIKNDYFAHTSPTGVSPWYWFAKAGYNYQYAGENLAIGFIDSDQVYQAWLNSPTHKANIINPHYQQVGTAVMSGFGSDNTTIVVQVFGTEKPKIQSPSATQKLQPVVIKPVKPPVITPKPSLQVSEEPHIPETLGKVLSGQSTRNPIVSSVPNPSWLSKLLSGSYNQFFQTAAFGISLILIGMLFTIALLSDKPIEKPLAVRTAGLVALMVFSLLVNQYLIHSIMPHQLFI